MYSGYTVVLLHEEEGRYAVSVAALPGGHTWGGTFPEARRMADEIIFIDRGRVVEQTPVAGFFTLPQTDAAQRFLKEETP